MAVVTPLKTDRKNMLKEFKIRFNTGFLDTPGLHWKVIIDGVELLVSDVVIENVRTFTTSHKLPSGEQKWSIACMADSYRMDEEYRLFIFNA